MQIFDITGALSRVCSRIANSNQQFVAQETTYRVPNHSFVPRSVQPHPDVSIGVVTDASCDVPAIERHDARWIVVPELWIIEGNDTVDIGESSRHLVRSILRDRQAVVTAPTVASLARAYEQLLRDGAEHVWSIHASGELSNTVTHAREAAAGMQQVTVVETGVASIGCGLLARRILQLASGGTQVDEIRSYVHRHAQSIRFLVVPDHFDPAGGRRLMAERLLSGVPMLSAVDGQITRSRRLRSRRATVSAIQQHVLAHAPADAVMHMAIGHGDAAGAVDPFLDIIERLRPEAVIDLVGRIGPRVMQQLGARCVGLAWIIE